jgi:hypothetical protein
VEYYTTRNLVILALTQAGTLVASVLAAGAAYKWHTQLPTREPPPLPCRLLSDFGWLGLILPVVWFVVAYWVFLRRGESAPARIGAVAAGVVLVALFLLAGWFGAVSPWARLTGSFHLW